MQNRRERGPNTISRRFDHKFSAEEELNSQKAITPPPSKKAANLWPDYNIHIQVSRSRGRQADRASGFNGNAQTQNRKSIFLPSAQRKNVNSLPLLSLSLKRFASRSQPFSKLHCRIQNPERKSYLAAAVIYGGRCITVVAAAAAASLASTSVRPQDRARLAWVGTQRRRGYYQIQPRDQFCSMVPP